MRSKEVEEVIKRVKRELTDEDKREYMSSWFAEDLDTLLSYIETLEQLPNKIRDKIKEIENDGIWITEDYYYDKELGEEYPIAQSNFSKEEMEDIVVDILKSIIGE